LATCWQSRQQELARKPRIPLQTLN
jgi:hypothetical protein